MGSDRANQQSRAALAGRRVSEAASSSAGDHIGASILVLFIAAALAALAYEVLSLGSELRLDAQHVAEIVGVLLVGGAYLLVRRGRVNVATWLVVGVSFAGVLLVAYLMRAGSDALDVLDFCLIPIIFAALALPLRWALAVAVACTLSMAASVFCYVTPETLRMGATHVMFVAVAGSLVVLGAHHRARHESRRRLEIVTQERKYRFLADSMADVLFTTDKDLVLDYVSPSIKRVAGFEPEELIGKTIHTALTSESMGRVLQGFREAAQKVREGIGEAPMAEYECVRKDGSTFWGEVRASVLVDDQGEIAGMQGVLRDCTERRRELEERVRLEDNVRHAEKMRAIGQLAGGIAHDYNNQLTGIMGCADLLRQSLRSDQDLYGLADMIVKSAERSAQLTGQLLSFARRSPLRMAPLNLHAVIGEVVLMLRHSLDKRIAIVQDLQARPSTTLGDIAGIQNALLNVAINARDAMPEGGEIRFATDTVDLDESFCRHSPFGIAPGAYVRTTITDTGTGMSREVQERIFEPFFTTKPMGAGAGMGLATVHGTVYAHRGCIEVHSEVGKGTRFAILLPIVPAQIIEAAVIGAEPTKTSRPARVLLVDDEDLVLISTARLLETQGYTVATARSGREAIDLCRDAGATFDVVVLDMAMPGVSGADTFRALRAEAPQLPIVIASGYVADEETRELLCSGPTRFLPKPYMGDELRREIEAVLGVKRGEG